MKTWVNNLLRNQNTGYVTFRTDTVPCTIPVRFQFERGHILFFLSILNYDKIQGIKTNPLISFSVINNDSHITLQGSAKIDESYLVKPKMDFAFPDTYDSEKNNIPTNIPFIRKLVIVDMKPSKISGKNSHENVHYELEIL